MSRRLPSLSAVIPAYNSAEILPELLDRLEPVLRDNSEAFEVILIDDASSDDTWRVIEELARERPWLRGVHLMRNYGQHNAVLCGVRAARYELVITMDDDLQHPPEELPKLLASLTDDVDVVYGAPRKQRHGLLRGLASRLTKLALKGFMGARTARKVSALRLFRTHLRDAFAGYASPFVSIDVLLTWGTTRFAAVDVEHAERPRGASGYTFGKLLTHAMNMMTGFSTVPLQIATWVGFSLALFGVGVLCYVLARYFLYGNPVPGFPFLASIIAIFSGAQLFALGIFGEYLARIHRRSTDQPPYAVRDEVGARLAP